MMPVVFLLLLGIVPLLAQADIPQTYAQLCAGCHGADARGSQQGPGLAGNLRLRRRSAQSLRNVITRGIPAAGMPGFALPEATLDGLVALVVRGRSCLLHTGGAGGAGSRLPTSSWRRWW
jgi:hypothetical protein